MMDNCRLSLSDRAGNSISITVTLEQHVHNYISEIVKESTCTENGLIKYTCSKCGDSYTEIIESLGKHKFVDGICTECGIKEYENFTLNKNNCYMANISTQLNMYIPATFEYDGRKYKIIAIDDNAFQGCEEITSIIIPNTVTKIGDAAFNQCSKLEYITIPDSVVAIGNNYVYSTGPFADCTSLKSVKLPNKINRINKSMFENCKSLTSFDIPNTVTEIKSYAFASSGLTSLNIPNGVNTIGDKAFYNIPHIYYTGTASGAPWGALSMN